MSFALKNPFPRPAYVHKAYNYVSEYESEGKRFGELKEPALRQLITQKICKPLFSAVTKLLWMNIKHSFHVNCISQTVQRHTLICNALLSWNRHFLCREQYGFSKCHRIRFTFENIFFALPQPHFAHSFDKEIKLQSFTVMNVWHSFNKTFFFFCISVIQLIKHFNYTVNANNTRNSHSSIYTRKKNFNFSVTSTMISMEFASIEWTISHSTSVFLLLLFSSKWLLQFDVKMPNKPHEIKKMPHEIKKMPWNWMNNFTFINWFRRNIKESQAWSNSIKMPLKYSVFF